MIKLLIFTLLSSLSYSVTAANYYFSSTGNDANDGLSPVSPWKSLSKVYLYPIFTAHFQPGDSLLLKAGDSFDGPMILSAGNSGTVGSRITIDRYGIGANPIVYGDHPSAVWSAVVAHPGVYSTDVSAGGGTVEAVFDINGNAYTKTNQGGDSLDVWLAKFNAGNWGLSGSVYIRTLDGNAPPQMHLWEFTTISIGSSYVTVQNIESCNGKFGIATGVASGVIARQNFVHDTLNIGIFYGDNSTNGEVASNIVTRNGETCI